MLAHSDSLIPRVKDGHTFRWAGGGMVVAGLPQFEGRHRQMAIDKEGQIPGPTRL